MNIKQKIVAFLLAIVAILGGTSVVNNLGGTAEGVPSTVATSSFQATTAGTARLLFATSTKCASRIITTQAGAIKLTFSDFLGQRPTAVEGHEQSASTTVAYPAENYGCNAVWVYPYGTNTLTVTETR
jgi:hypothetical protein